jgi:hypothetical protein
MKQRITQVNEHRGKDDAQYPHHRISLPSEVALEAHETRPTIIKVMRIKMPNI